MTHEGSLLFKMQGVRKGNFRISPNPICEKECFAPLEVSYDYDALGRSSKREALVHRAFNMWRYAGISATAGRLHMPAASVGARRW